MGESNVLLALVLLSVKKTLSAQVSDSFPSQFPLVIARSRASLRVIANPTSPKGRNYLTCLKRLLLLYHASQMCHPRVNFQPPNVALCSSH